MMVSFQRWWRSVLRSLGEPSAVTSWVVVGFVLAMVYLIVLAYAQTIIQVTGEVGQ